MRNNTELPAPGVFAPSPIQPSASTPTATTRDLPIPTASASAPELPPPPAFIPTRRNPTVTSSQTGAQASSSSGEAGLRRRHRDSSSAYSNIDLNAYSDGPLRATLNRIVEIERLRSRISHLESLSNPAPSNGSREAHPNPHRSATRPQQPSAPPSLPPLRFEHERDRDREWTSTAPWRVNEQAVSWFNSTFLPFFADCPGNILVEVPGRRTESFDVIAIQTRSSTHGGKHRREEQPVQRGSHGTCSARHSTQFFHWSPVFGLSRLSLRRSPGS